VPVVGHGAFIRDSCCSWRKEKPFPALKAGAQGYLLKNTIHKELTETIRAVHAGKKALSPEASFEIAEHATDDALTPAEINVLRLIAAGNANKQIADQLSITEETVKGSQEHPLQAGCQRPNAGGHDRAEARNHRTLVSRKSPPGPNPEP